jgi:DNA repair protein RadA/Sms
MPVSRFTCRECGWTFGKLLGKCPGCDAVLSFEQIGMRPLAEVSVSDTERLTTSWSGLDGVLGGGIVPGSVVLVGGLPGLGKSTLLTQLAINVAHAGLVVAYVSAEESLAQMRLRADRLTLLLPPTLLVDVEANLSSILREFERSKPQLVIVDSIQMLTHPQIKGEAGGAAQVRGCAERIVVWAKRNRVAVFVVSHVTKGGGMAGPGALQHVVDTVLMLENARRYPLLRRLRVLKNRFGSTTEFGVFAMLQHGLQERFDVDVDAA